MQGRSVLVIVISILVGLLAARNFKIRRDCRYSAKLTPPLKLALILSLAILVWVGLSFGSSVWDVWLALICGLYLFSAYSGRGIHDKGIYYLPGRSLWLRYIPWENIQSIEIDLKQGQLVSFESKDRPYILTVRQVYSTQALESLQEKVPTKIVSST